MPYTQYFWTIVEAAEKKEDLEELGHKVEMLPAKGNIVTPWKIEVTTVAEMRAETQVDTLAAEMFANFGGMPELCEYDDDERTALETMRDNMCRDW